MSAGPDLPEHVEETVRAVAELHVTHHLQASLLQRTVSRLTGGLARPRSVIVLTLILAGWVIANLLLWRIGVAAPDPPPFSILQTAASVAALYMTFLILVSQRHDDELANRREQMTLQLAMLSEQKVAKVIQLLEELRRDDPMLHNRPDQEAAAMAHPSDSAEVSRAVEESNAELFRENSK